MRITVNCHSSIRIAGDKVIYFDPFKIERAKHDADYIFITHDHYDHFSVDDIKKVEKEDTVYVIPDCMYNLLGGENVITMKPGDVTNLDGIMVEAVPSYNHAKQFHLKEKGYLGYVLFYEGKRVYVAGDCDINDDNLKITCDIALIPIGGHYTMDYKEAARFINKIAPEIAIPTHYGDLVGKMDVGEKFAELVHSEIKVRLKIN